MITLKQILTACNTEPKLLAISYGLSNKLQGCGEIRNNIIKKISNDRLPKSSSFKDYCEHSFISEGIVEKKVIKSKADYIKIIKRNPSKKITKYPIKTYKLTTEGEYIVPITKYLLCKSADLNESIYSSLGQTSNKKAPYTRAVILNKLLLRNNKRKSDINVKGISQGGLKNNLLALARNGLIEYDYINHELENYSKYEYKKCKKNYVSRFRGLKLTDEVLDLLKKEKKPMGCAEINKELEYTNKGVISNILRHLKKEGHVRACEFNFEKNTNARITIKGIQFYKEIIKPIKDFIKDDKEVILNYLLNTSNNELINKSRKAIKLYIKASPALNRLSRDEQEKRIINCLIKPKRPKQISNELGIKNPYKYLKPLLDKGLIKKEGEKNIIYYSLK